LENWFPLGIRHISMMMLKKSALEMLISTEA